MRVRKIVGLQPNRAEVILAGACIVAAIMDKLRCESLSVSDRGLRHGLLIDRFGGKLARAGRARRRVVSLMESRHGGTGLPRGCGVVLERPARLGLLAVVFHGAGLGQKRHEPGRGRRSLGHGGLDRNFEIVAILPLPRARR